MPLDPVARTLIVGGLALAAAWPLMVRATGAVEAPAPSRDTLFEQLDVDRDGRLSQAEAGADPQILAAFGEADTNRDGALSAEEYTKARSIYDRKRLARYAPDAAITAKVKAALAMAPEVNPFAVSVETDNGRVMLSGVVDRPEQKEQAGKVAAGVAGVKNVSNALEIK